MRNLFLSVLVLGSIKGTAQNDGQYSGCLDSLEIPSSFTPNGDGKNDLFMIDFPCVPEELTITIYNGWGEEIYETRSHSFAWNGSTDKGDLLPADVYFYKISYVILGEKTEISGNLALIR